MADYVTSEQLQKFATDLENYVQTTIQNDDVEFAKVIKEYVEGRLADLESSIVNSDEWVKIKDTIDALLQVFDENKDGSLTPEEILAKIGELKASIDALSDRVTNVEGKIDTINTTIGSIQSDVESVKQNLTNTKTALESEIANTKTALESEIADTKTALESEIADNINALDQKVAGNVSEICGAVCQAVENAFISATNTVCERMNEVRKVFELAQKDCSATDSSASGDGATL
jgi:predicted  nucleic acid-binding Zn-ribbon protein